MVSKCQENLGDEGVGLDVRESVMAEISNRDQVQEIGQVQRANCRGFGIICGLLGGSFFAVNNIFIKMLSDSVHPVQIGLVICYCQFLILCPVMQYKSKDVDILGPRSLRLCLWLRGFFGSTSMVFMYAAIGKLSVGNAVTITFLKTMMIPVMARVCLKESLTVLDGLFALLALGGVVLIAQPTFLFPVQANDEPQSAVGVMYALMNALCGSFVFITIRKLGKETHFLLNVFYSCFCGSLTTTALLFAIGGFSYPCLSDVPLLFSLGIISLLGQSFTTLALQRERAGTVSVLRTIQIILVYVMQVVFLNDIPSVLSVVGASLILSSSSGIGIRKIVNEKRRK